MHDAWTLDPESWHDFFLLIGTAGVTLTGLLFVVISLGPRLIANHEATGVRAFISPNAVFFSSTLVVSAVFMMPGLPARVLGSLLVMGAIASVGYMIYTRAHQRWKQSQLPRLDWVWFVGLPLAAYFVLLASGVSFLMHGALSFLLVAAGLILLLVIGIRNAWDLVIWVSQKEHSDKPDDADQEATPPAG